MRPAPLALLLVLCVLLVIWRPWIDDSPARTSAAEPGAQVEKPEPSTEGSQARRPPAPPQIDLKRSSLAESLNDSKGTIGRDLETVQELFSHYRSVLGGNPTGSNREITTALSGGNPRLYAPLPRDHSAINREGELVDRWRTPFFFHSLSAEFIEIRSAGPDRRLWTADDQTLTNAPLKPTT